MAGEIARNAPCPCGSGKRYKNCHGALPTTEETTPASNASEDPRLLLQHGLELRRRGDHAQAERAMQRVLALDPHHPDAWHLLSLLDLDRNDPAGALAKVERAIAVYAEHPQFHITHARILHTRGNREGALAAIERALALAPHQAEAWTVRGLVFLQRDAQRAATAWEQALAIDAGAAEAAFHLGNYYRGQGDPAQAIAVYERTLQHHPQDAQLLNNLGLALSALARHGEAEGAFRRAVAADGSLTEAQANLCQTLYEQGRYSEAQPLLESAVRHRPELARLWAKLGDCQCRTGNVVAGQASFDKAIALEPGNAKFRMDVAILLHDQERIAEAIAHYRAALAIDPTLTLGRIQLLFAEQQLCDWTHFDELVGTLKHYLDDQAGTNFAPFLFLYLPMSPAEQLRAAQIWVRDKIKVEPSPRPRLRRASGDRLRIGYLSPDFRFHPMAHLISELLERHDRTRCEIYAYAYGPHDESPFRARISRAVDHWRDIGRDSDERAVERIRADGIHVLIDLNGYTEFARNRIAALRPAPPQMTWLGYLGTMGAPWYDYIVTDRFVSPSEQQVHFSERFLYLPHCYCPSDTQRQVDPHTLTRAQSGLPEYGFVFCCFNNAFKILPDLFRVWMSLLREVEASVLWLAPTDPAAAGHLRAEAAKLGVEGARLVFAPRLPPAQHFARLRTADLFLDTYPYNAGTTANDALFVGLPLLTLAGDTYASRVAGSQLHALGLPELVTHSFADYAAKACELALDANQMANVRERLAKNRATFPLFDMQRFTRDFEDTLLRAWDDNADAP